MVSKFGFNCSILAALPKSPHRNLKFWPETIPKPRWKPKILVGKNRFFIAWAFS